MVKGQGEEWGGKEVGSAVVVHSQDGLVPKALLAYGVVLILILEMRILKQRE